MILVIQRVSSASVVVGGEERAAIGRGLLALVGLTQTDTDADLEWSAAKLAELRIFEDDAGKMNLSVLDVGGALLAVSQFTLFGDVRKGKRPSFGGAMEPGGAERLFELFCEACRERGLTVETGRFRTHMEVELVNSGPVTVLVDTARTF